MHSMRGLVPLCLIVGLAAGCVNEPARTPAKTEPASAAKGAAGADAPAKVEAADAKATPAPLSAEDKRLIAADPKTLSPEDVRKRSFALRRKIMLAPDSPQAAVFKDLEAAAAAGELGPPPNLGEAGAAAEAEPKKDYPTFHLPGTEAPQGVEKPPAGTAPTPDKNDAP